MGWVVRTDRSEPTGEPNGRSPCRSPENLTRPEPETGDVCPAPHLGAMASTAGFDGSLAALRARRRDRQLINTAVLVASIVCRSRCSSQVVDDRGTGRIDLVVCDSQRGRRFSEQLLAERLGPDGLTGVMSQSVARTVSFRWFGSSAQDSAPFAWSTRTSTFARASALISPFLSIAWFAAPCRQIVPDSRDDRSTTPVDR